MFPISRVYKNSKGSASDDRSKASTASRSVGPADREKEMRTLKGTLKQLSILLKIFTYEEDYGSSSDLCNLWVLAKKVEHAVKEDLEGYMRGL